MRKTSGTKAARKPLHISTKKLCGMAVLTALSTVFACTVHFPYFAAPFLEYSPSDVPILIASFMYGPIAGLVITLIVSLIQGFTVSAASGIIGVLMNCLSTGAFVLSAGLVYRFNRTMKGAIYGLITGFFAGVVTIILWNILITPLYMGVDRAVVIAMIPTVFLPFNLIKYAANAVLTFLLYKATGKLFNAVFKNLDNHKTAGYVKEERPKLVGDAAENSDKEANALKSICTKTSDGSMETSCLNGLTGEYRTSNVAETYALAERVASTLKGGETILLSGELGAGKTTFTKGLAAALGIKGEVTSPTFTIMNVYEDGRLKLNHLDMYRLESADDLIEVGVEDAIADGGVTVIEWNKLENLDGRIIKIDIKNGDGSENSDGCGRIFQIEDCPYKAHENTCN